MQTSCFPDPPPPPQPLGLCKEAGAARGSKPSVLGFQGWVGEEGRAHPCTNSIRGVGEGLSMTRHLKESSLGLAMGHRQSWPGAPQLSGEAYRCVPQGV